MKQLDYYEPENLLDIAAQACEEAIKEGADQAEVFVSFGSGISVDLEKSAIKSSDIHIGGGLSVRAFSRGGVGSASADNLSEASIVETARAAAQMAKIAEPDPDFISLPGAAEYPEVVGLFDPAVAELSVGDVVRMAVDNIDSAKSVVGDAIVSGGASAGHKNWALANSLGVRGSGRSSGVSVFAMVIVKRGDDVGAYYDFDEARRLADFEPVGVGRSAAEMAVKFLGARKVKTRIMPVVLGPLAGISIYQSIASSVNAEDIQRGRSFMADMKGRRIGSDVLGLVDDPLIEGGLSSRFCDGEGFPSRRTTIVEEGVLKSYLHNSYTANKAKEMNTGHGTRGGISPSNLVPKLGVKTSEQIISEVNSGLYIAEGQIAPNMVTGEVSVSVDFGFMIENGEIAYPVQNTMVGGDFLQMLANVDAVSSDYRSEPGVILPTVRIQNVSVAGGM